MEFDLGSSCLLLGLTSIFSHQILLIIAILNYCINVYDYVKCFTHACKNRAQKAGNVKNN